MRSFGLAILLSLGVVSMAVAADEVKPVERFEMRHHGEHAGKTISREEFAAKAMERFNRIDVNGDGQLTKEERQAARNSRNLHKKEH